MARAGKVAANPQDGDLCMPLSAAPRGLLQQSELGIFRDVERFFDETDFLDPVDALLNYAQIRLPVEIAVKILFGEQPVLEDRRWALEEPRDHPDRLPVIG